MKHTIVWIDDDWQTYPDLIEPLMDTYYVLTYRSAQEALGALDELHGASLIILDMIIPRGAEQATFGYYTGLDLLTRLRRQEGVTTPVIALTVVSRDEIKTRLKELGVSETLVKPVLASELKACVDELLA
jgi:DNA-binding response OmpR family regulator